MNIVIVAIAFLLGAMIGEKIGEIAGYRKSIDLIADRLAQVMVEDEEDDCK